MNGMRREQRACGDDGRSNPTRGGVEDEEPHIIRSQDDPPEDSGEDNVRTVYCVVHGPVSSSLSKRPVM